MIKNEKCQLGQKVFIQQSKTNAPNNALSWTKIPKTRIITCSCGTEILLIPDLRVMNHAIEAHLAIHLKQCKETGKNPKTIDDLRRSLIEQIFMSINKTYNLKTETMMNA